MANGKIVLVRTAHHLVKSITSVKQFAGLCTLQRNNLVDIPFEYNNFQGCCEFQSCINELTFDKLTLVLQVCPNHKLRCHGAEALPQVVDVFSSSVDETHTRGHDKIMAHFVSFWWNGRTEIHMEGLIDLQPLSEIADFIDVEGVCVSVVAPTDCTVVAPTDCTD